ncbi:hypothetical protein Tco_1119962 [Tanacetum coccineum]
MLLTGSITTWDLLEKAVTWKYCPPFKTARKLEEIRNFKQGMDETLYQAWERYNDLLFRCPQHDLNNHQKGLIPMLPPARALKSIQDIADHLPYWYDGATTWQGSNHNSNDIVVITNRLDSLGYDMKKLKESIHAMQEGCKSRQRVHITQECHFRKEDKEVEHVKYMGFLEETIKKYCEESIKVQVAHDEWINKSRINTDLNLKKLDGITKNLQVKADQLTQAILTNNIVDKVKRKMKKGIEVKKKPVPFDLPIVNPYVEPIVPPIPFPRHLKEQEDEAQAFRMLEGLKKLKINQPLIRVVRRMPG